MSNIEQRALNQKSIALTLFEGSIMSDLQPPSSIVPRDAIERPACPRCNARMMLARIVPAFLGTDLHTFECVVCNHVVRKLGAYEGPMDGGRSR